MKTLKLYLVTLRGMTYATTGVVHGVNYVVAENPDQAYAKVKRFLDEKDLGFAGDRELKSIELLAEGYEFTSTRTMLFLHPQESQ